MVLIHTADLHLDSVLTSLPKDKIAARRDELIVTFGRMVEYAKTKGAAAILIAGDLFDTSQQQQVRIKQQVSAIIKDARGIDFLYLCGNHDVGDFLSSMADKPANLKTFRRDKWTSYTYGDVVVTGLETGSGAIDPRAYSDLVLDTAKTNIVMLHGQIVSGWSANGKGAMKDNASIIDLNHLAAKGIDYLALGHIHKRQKGDLGKDGTWCYPGCLEGRGFDECGEKGFVKLTIEGKKIERAFVPCAKRSIHEVRVPLKGSLSFDEVKSQIDKAIAAIPRKDIVKVVLCGGISEDTYIDTAAYLPLYAERLYFLKIYDETERVVDYKKYAGDVSLKGYFIRKVLADNTISARDKGEIIHMGISALSGKAF